MPFPFFSAFFEAMDNFSSIVTAEGVTENESVCPTLSFKTRLTGFFACFVIGLIFNVFSWVTVFMGDYIGFAMLFTLGNISAISGSLFLAGPLKQAKRMFNESRWIATTVYILSLIATIVVAVLLNNGFLVIICSLIQWGAMWWYFLSYIPGGRECIKGVVAAKFG